MKKIILFFLSFMICIGLCFYLRQNVRYTSFQEVLSTTHNIDLSSSFEGFSNTHPRSTYVDDYVNVYHFNELCKQADIIANISVKERKQQFNIVETTVNINKIYQGFSNKEMIIYEPICFNGKGDCIAYSSIPLLHKNQDYIVFLKKALPNDGTHYNYVNSCLGVFPVTNNLKIETVTLKDGENINFKKSMNYDVIKLDYSKIPEEILDKEALDNYYKHIHNYERFHNQVMKQFK